MLSTVEFRTENAGTVLVAAAPGQWRRQLADVAARYAGLAAAASLRRAFAAIGATPLELYAEVWCIYTFLSLFTSTFATALAAAGFQPQTVFNSPLLRTTSVSDFWGRRWNLLIHGLFRRSVFQPFVAAAVRHGRRRLGLRHLRPIPRIRLAPASQTSQPRPAAASPSSSRRRPSSHSIAGARPACAGAAVAVPHVRSRMHGPLDDGARAACTALPPPLKQSGVFEELEALVPRPAFDDRP